MSDMHVLDGDGETVKVVMHFGVPAGNNSVGTSWVAAVLSTAPTTILPDGDGTDGTIETTEKSAIEAGTIFEHVTRVHADGSGQTTGGRQAVLRNAYAVAEAAVTADIQSRFKFYGHTESEA